MRAAAERIRILHSRIILRVRRQNGASLQLVQYRRRYRLLPRLIACSMNARIKERVGGAARINGKRGCPHGCLQERFHVMHCQRADRAHVVRPIDERQSFLGSKWHGFQIHSTQRVAPRHALPAKHRFAFTKEHQRQV